MNKDQIRKILNGTDKEKYSHVLICVDTWDYHYFDEKVKREYDIDEFIGNFWKNHKGGMFKIEEVYNLDLDIEEQLSEYRSNHREKANRKIIEKYPEMETKSERALEFAIEKHKGQFRKGNNPKEYITHPINVANLVKCYVESTNIDSIVAAAYLHDAIESAQDKINTYYEIGNKFGFLVASLVNELTSDKDLQKEIGKAKYLAIKMKNMSDTALIIKLCDRLDNISSLADVDIEFRKNYVCETIYILNYLINNKKLGNTHITIISNIINIITTIMKYDCDYENNEKEIVNKLKLEINEKNAS